MPLEEIPVPAVGDFAAVSSVELHAALHIVAAQIPGFAFVVTTHNAHGQRLNAYRSDVKRPVRERLALLVGQIVVEPRAALHCNACVCRYCDRLGGVGQLHLEAGFGVVVVQVANPQRAHLGGIAVQWNIHKAGENAALACGVAGFKRADGIAAAKPCAEVCYCVHPFVKGAFLGRDEGEVCGTPHQIPRLKPLCMINIVQHPQRVLVAQQRLYTDRVAVDFGGQRFVQHLAVFLHQCVRLVGGAHGVEKPQHHRARGH